MPISEILRFVVPRSQSSIKAFSDFRNHIATKALVRTQYFGYVLQNEGFPLPKTSNQMCWYIEWPDKSQYRMGEEFRKELSQIATDEPKGLKFEFASIKPDGIRKGLESEVTEFAIINLNSKASRFNNEFEASMEKTYTDCYLAKGFTDGGWGYALNSNDSDGSDEELVLEEKEKRLALYLLGWDSVADHHVYEKTELFAVEIDKLKTHFGPGTGAFYVKFEAHV